MAGSSAAVNGTSFEGFSLSHAAILSGTTGAEAATVYGVNNGTISTDQGNFENTGDDVVLVRALLDQLRQRHDRGRLHPLQHDCADHRHHGDLAPARRARTTTRSRCGR